MNGIPSLCPYVLFVWSSLSVFSLCRWLTGKYDETRSVQIIISFFVFLLIMIFFFCLGFTVIYFYDVVISSSRLVS